MNCRVSVGVGTGTSGRGTVFCFSGFGDNTSAVVGAVVRSWLVLSNDDRDHWAMGVSGSVSLDQSWTGRASQKGWEGDTYSATKPCLTNFSRAGMMNDAQRID